jgi:thiol-disulfide isomerase/thioredoxin
MTGSRQWATVAAVVATLAFGVALTLKLRPQIVLIEVGSRARDFPAVALPARTPVTFADAYRGKVVLLNVWATWCQPCRIEMPSLERLQREFAGTDFHVVAVSVDKEGPDVVEAFVKELGLSFDILHDQTADIQRVYQTTGVPESFLIDRDGVIIKKVIGAVEWDNPVNTLLVRRLLDAR